MEPQQEIIQTFRQTLEPLSYVHALWLEGSIPQGFRDEYSDIDLWLSVDDEKFIDIYTDIDALLTRIGVIDLRYIMKYNDELGHIIYHVKGMSEFLTIDVNVQKLSRNVQLVEGLDVVEVIFDKSNVIRFRPENIALDVLSPDRLRDFFQAMHPNVVKNVRRHRLLEAYHYYDGILEEVIKYFRLKAWHAEKVDYWRKHIYRDLSNDTTKKLEYFTFTEPENLEKKLEELGKWIISL